MQVRSFLSPIPLRGIRASKIRYVEYRFEIFTQDCCWSQIYAGDDYYEIKSVRVIMLLETF